MNKKPIKKICKCGGPFINQGVGNSCEECLNLLYEYIYEIHVQSLEFIIKKLKNDNPLDRITSIISLLREPVFARTSIKKYILSYFPVKGIVKEHINGCYNIAVYALYAIYINEIKDWRDLKTFYETYGVQIKTCKNFNQFIKKRVQHTGYGAPLCAEYIDAWEIYYEEKLDETIKTQLTNHFLANKYTKMNHYDLLKFIKEDLNEKA